MDLFRKPAKTFSDYGPDDTKMYVSVRCPICSTGTSVLVNRNRYAAWEDGAMIQSAMPELPAVLREALISGICPICWQKMEDEAKKLREDGARGL